VHGGFDLQRAVLHVEHEPHDFRIVGFRQSQGVDLRVIVQIAEILQKIKGEAVAVERSGAEFADERLPVTLLPHQVRGLAQTLREWRKIVAPHAKRRVVFTVEWSR